MKKLFAISLAALALTASSMPAVLGLEAVSEEKDAKIIVQLKASTEGKSSEEILKVQNQVLRTIDSTITMNYTVESRFFNAFNGFVLNIPKAYVSEIRNLSSVNSIDYDRIVAQKTLESDLAHEIKKSVQIDDKTENVSAVTMNKPESTTEGQGIFVAVLDTGFMINANYVDEEGETHTNETHNVFSELPGGTLIKETKDTIASKVSASKGFHGKPDSSHTTYYNNKVPFYYDYGGETNEYEQTGPEDYDVFAPGQDHGNHVASIIGGNANEYKGIASKVQFALMKVFTVYTPKPEEAATHAAYCSAFESALLKAIEDCATLGVDMVNMSLGTTLDDFDKDSVFNQAITNLQNRGMFINIAAGNDGKNTFNTSAYEFWTTDMVETGILSGHSNANAPMDIAAAQPTKVFYEKALTVGDKTVSYYDQIVSYQSSSSEEVVYNPERYLTDLLQTHPDGVCEWVKVPNLGAAEDYQDIDAKGKIAIIDRGDLTFTAKITNAVNAGAIAVGIINNDPTELTFTFRMDLAGYQPPVPVVSILYRDKVTFDTVDTTSCKIVQNEVVNNPTAKTMADFSSDGATFDLQLKPEIATPGQGILGAVLDSKNAYDYFDGTSMAAPNYCGAMALVLAEKPLDADYRKTANARLMSTANPMMDGYGKNYDSVRRQGAGMVDINGAIKTNVYLDGSSTLGSLTNKAKIELGNNSDIASGNLKLSFTAVNSSDSPVTYKATTYIYRPELAELDAEQFPELSGKKLQATYDHLIDKVEQNITVQPGTSIINLNDYSITGSEKTDLDTYFENGTYIEGFVMLTAEGQEDLSIPYLGFYGDYSKASPVEPFRFERDSNKVYPSDLMNSICYKWGGSSFVDFASDWVMGYYPSMEDVDMEQVIYNESNLRQMVDYNKKALVPVGTDPKTGEISKDNIVLGNNGFANTMIIQQFVTRSVATNTITIVEKATGKTILVDHMYDSLYGSVESESGKETSWPLYKSHMDVSFYSSKIFAHRAYTIIPLYGMDENHKQTVLYPDGEYEINFSYTTAAGSYKFEKSYNFTISSDVPAVQKTTNYAVESENYMRIDLGNDPLSYVAVEGKYYELKQDENGYYVEVKESDYSNGKVFMSTNSSSYAEGKSITHFSDPNNVYSVSNSSLNLTHDYISSLTDIDENNKLLELTYVKAGTTTKSGITKGTVTVTMKLPTGFNESNLKVYQYKSEKTQKRIHVDFVGDNIVFTGDNPSYKYRLCNDPAISTDYKLTSLIVNSPYTEYFVGESLKTTDLLVAVKDETGTLRYLKDNEYSVDTSKVDMASEGTYIVTVSYVADKTLKCTYNVIVYAKDNEPVVPTLDVTPIVPTELYTVKGSGANNTTIFIVVGAVAATIAIAAGIVLAIYLPKRKKDVE